DWATGYVPPHPILLIVYVAVEGLALLSLGLVLSTRLSGIMGGVIARVAWLLRWIRVVADVGGAARRDDAVENIGIISRLILPSGGLWRGAVYAMEPDAVLAQLRLGGTLARANPFAAVDPPPIAFLAWVAVWFATMLALSIWSFRTREI